MVMIKIVLYCTVHLCNYGTVQ